MKHLYSIIFTLVWFCASCTRSLEPIQPDSASSNNSQQKILPNGDTLVSYQNGLSVVKKGDSYLFQDDMMLTAEQVELLANPPTGKGSYDFDFWSKRWDSHVIPYAANIYPNMNLLNKAIEHLENCTNLRFVPRTNEPDYLVFREHPDVSDSYVGRIGGGQVINIKNGTSSLSVVVHEIGHAIGLMHEHSRSDRDEYIIVNYDNIRPEKRDQFWKARNDRLITPFDYESIMMYSGYLNSAAVFNINIPVIVKRSNGEATKQGYRLSAGDISALAQMYSYTKYGTSGSQLVEPGARGVTYHINGLAPDIDRVARVEWSTSSTFPATIISGQGTPQITVDFPNQSGTHYINATIVFRNGDRRAMSPRMVGCTVHPVVNAIRYSKYFQGDGEYTLYAEMANDNTVSTQWQCNTSALFHELPYPDDGSFSLHPNLYTAVDFYQPGPHQVTVFATNAAGVAVHTENIHVYDTKTTAFPMHLAPNPATQGQVVTFEMTATQPLRNAVIDQYDIEIRNAQNALVYAARAETSKATLNVAQLPCGKYHVTSFHKNTKKRYVSVLEIK